jgi:hypothetical protein
MPITRSNQDSIVRKPITHTASRAGAPTVSCHTARVTVRPMLRRAVLAAAAAGAAAALALGPSAPSFAAAGTTVVNTTNQAGYLVGGNGYQFRFVQGYITPLKTECTDPNGHNNYRNSGVQLIGAPGASAAVGVECIDVFGPHYFVGWAQGYSGNTFPSLTHVTTTVAASDQILLQLYYDVDAGVVHFTAIDETKQTSLVSAAVPAGPA